MIYVFIDCLKMLLLAGLILSLWSVVTTKLLMPKVFWLIALFVQLSYLLLLNGIEFISFVILLIYVGAISILFLFVVMILNPDVKQELAAEVSEKKQLPTWVNQYSVLLVPLGLITLLYFVFSGDSVTPLTAKKFSFHSLWVDAWPHLDKFFFQKVTHPEFHKAASASNNANSFVNFDGISGAPDMWRIANTLYTEEFVAFWLVGLILLVSIIGAILLTLQKSTTLKRQNGTAQSKRYHAFGQ